MLNPSESGGISPQAIHTTLMNEPKPTVIEVSRDLTKKANIQECKETEKTWKEEIWTLKVEGSVRKESSRLDGIGAQRCRVGRRFGFPRRGLWSFAVGLGDSTVFPLLVEIFQPSTRWCHFWFCYFSVIDFGISNFEFLHDVVLLFIWTLIPSGPGIRSRSWPMFFSLLKILCKRINEKKKEFFYFFIFFYVLGLIFI